MQYSALNGRLIAELIPEDRNQTKDGIIIINRKELPLKAKVLSVGKEFKNSKGKVWHPPCHVGDTVHFKQYKPYTFSGEGNQARKSGKVCIWFEDILAIEWGEN